MSNEYKDWQNDLRAEFEEKVAELDLMYDGWINTFIPQLKDELFNALGPYVTDWEPVQIKEKYSELRIYWCWADREYTADEVEDLNALYDEIEDIIRKYSDISYDTCAKCGAKATKRTTGWIISLCSNCFEDM